MLKIWTTVFELPEEGLNLEDAVVTCLQATRSEIELLRSRLLSIDVAEDMMSPGLPRLRNYTSTTALNSGWNNFREEAIRPENRLFLVWANWALRDDVEDDMSANDLATLTGELDSLEKSLNESDMTSYLRGFVQRQIDVIRGALRVYRVQGVRPIEEALKQVAGAYTVDKVRVESEHEKASESTKSVVQKVGAFIEKTAKIADQLDKIRKAADGAVTLASTVGPTLIAIFSKS